MEPIFDLETFKSTVIVPEYDDLMQCLIDAGKDKDKVYLDFLNRYISLRRAINKSYDDQQKCFWISASVDFENDLLHFNSLSDSEKHLIRIIMAFFASSDIIIVSKIKEYLDAIALPDVSRVYDYMKMMENVHSEIYQRTIQIITIDRDDCRKLFNSINNLESIKNMANWCRNNNIDKIEEIVFVNGLFECAFFRTPFAIIATFKRNGKMPGIGQSNEYIMRDEDMHWRFAILMKQLLHAQISQDRAYEIVEEAKDLYFQFIDDMIPTPLFNLDRETVRNHFLSICDLFLVAYGFKKLYNARSTLDAVSDNDLPTHYDFFASRSTNYGKITSKQELNYDEDF
jgi:ribonucleotide reductase beta subunit family protein with ferritin-like domain